MPAAKERLNPDAHLVGEISRRNGLLSLAAVSSLLPHKTDNACEKLMQAFVRKGLYERFVLYDQVYYRLTEAGARFFGAAQAPVPGMGRHSVIVHSALLYLAVDYGETLLTKDELHARYEGLFLTGAANGHYLVKPNDGGERLYRVVVDCGAKPRRLAGKCRRIIGKMKNPNRRPGSAAEERRQEALRRFVLAGRFGLILLVPNEEKQKQVEVIISQNPPAYVPVHVLVIEQIERLVLEAGRKKR